MKDCLQSVLQEPCNTFKEREDNRDRIGEEQQEKEEVGQHIRMKEKAAKAKIETYNFWQ